MATDDQITGLVSKCVDVATANYKSVGDGLGIDLSHNPSLVQKDSAVAWRTNWFRNISIGTSTMAPHSAMVDRAGFGKIIRALNGSLECDGKNPRQVQSRVSTYQRLTTALGLDKGSNDLYS
ncbi:glycoside hydrolase family 19 protein [Streptomyces sp. NPDC088354]|uniref:glycoside hydrolase family 19 protein n=1 Tax=Streptomyces sp. NPDC088354 TaxID=3365856 RepID=UPI00380FB357